MSRSREREMEEKKIIGLIPARLGSTRLPRKMLLDIEGKSVLQRTYERAKQCSSLSLVAIACEEDELIEHVASFGAKAIKTSACRNGTERIAEAIASNSTFSDAEIIINIQGDEPLIHPEVIESVVAVLLNDPESVMSTACVAVHENEDDPNSVKCVFDTFGNALYFSRSPIPTGKGPHYKHLGIYGFRKEFLLQFPSMPDTPLQMAEQLEQLKALELGYKIKVAVVKHDSIGVDVWQDLENIRLQLR